MFLTVKKTNGAKLRRKIKICFLQKKRQTILQMKTQETQDVQLEKCLTTFPKVGNEYLTH